MDGENGRRLNTKTNVPDDRGVKHTQPISVVSSDRSSTSSITKGESNREGNGSSSAKTAVLHNADLPKCVEASFRLEKSTNGSPEASKRSSDVARDSFVLTESPAIQVMERPKTPDPNRGASSNSARSDSPNRWSVDSNESLFSIGVGNDSFSKEQRLSISGDMHGIGELSLSEAYLPRVSPRPEHNSPAAKAIIDEALKEVKAGVNKPDVDAKNRDPPEASISIHTDSNLSQSTDPRASDVDNKSHNRSFSSTSSSASGCPMCQWLCCYKTEWCCKWPSFCCRWPTCSCCSWFHWPKCLNICSSCPSCCSCCSKCCGSCCCCPWKRETKRVSSVSSYALMDRNVASSSKHNL